MGARRWVRDADRCHRERVEAGRQAQGPCTRACERTLPRCLPLMRGHAPSSKALRAAATALRWSRQGRRRMGGGLGAGVEHSTCASSRHDIKHALRQQAPAAV